MEIDKQQQRSEAAKRLKRLYVQERKRFDQRICELILGSNLYASCEQVLMYVPLADEVDIAEIHERAEQGGKKVFVPVSDPPSRAWSFRRWQVGAELRRGVGNVAEPTDGEAPHDLPSLCLVPGRAFTRGGQRLGRGSGCYDRLMHRLDALGITVGVAYECQIVDELPSEAFDRPVQQLVTEAGLFPCLQTSSVSR